MLDFVNNFQCTAIPWTFIVYRIIIIWYNVYYGSVTLKKLEIRQKMCLLKIQRLYYYKSYYIYIFHMIYYTKLCISLVAFVSIILLPPLTDETQSQ